MEESNSNRKNRKEFITATTKPNTTSLTFDYDPSTDRFIFHEADPETTKSNVSYDRASGKEKILSAIPSRDISASVNHLSNLKNSVDYLCAIDTNSRIIGDRKVAVSVICQVPGILREYKGSIPFNCLYAYLITGVADDINPEVIGWHIFLSRNIISNHFVNGRRLGLVIDSELDKLDSINSKICPYYESYYLPDYVHLIYASSDSGKEYLANRLLSSCDSAAKQILDKIQRDHLKIPKLNNGDKNFSGFCKINCIS